MVVVSLGLGGFALSYVSVLAPYQRYIQFVTIGLLMWAHYRMDKQVMKRSTIIFIWTATVAVMLFLLSPLITRLLLY